MLLIVIQIFNFLLPGATSIPAVYDQRQSGNTNVRIDVKDAVLIAITDELGDYDYSYDYSDLTVKPEGQASTTSKPSTTVSILSMTMTDNPKPEQNTSVIIDTDNSTLTFVTKPTNGSEKITVVHSQPSQSGQDYQIPVIVVQDTKEAMKLLPVKILEKSAVGVRRTNSSDESPQLRHCSQGFFLDSHNRCKRIRKTLTKARTLQSTVKSTS